jgi:hypothetical protein
LNFPIVNDPLYNENEIKNLNEIKFENNLNEEDIKEMKENLKVEKINENSNEEIKNEEIKNEEKGK